MASEVKHTPEARKKSLVEQRAEALADASDHSGGLTGRPYFMVGVMTECSLGLERVLGLIASGEVRGRDAQRLAKDALDELRPRAIAKAEGRS
ncbi:hypothetical protein XM25_08000 [Devosia sp. H5989]|nr:hypothetical protein XM25_08000 [Devosia sp. H5989]